MPSPPRLQRWRRLRQQPDRLRVLAVDDANTLSQIPQKPVAGPKMVMASAVGPGKNRPISAVPPPRPGAMEDRTGPKGNLLGPSPVGSVVLTAETDSESARRQAVALKKMTRTTSEERVLLRQSSSIGETMCGLFSCIDATPLQRLHPRSMVARVRDGTCHGRCRLQFGREYGHCRCGIGGSDLSVFRPNGNSIFQIPSTKAHGLGTGATTSMLSRSTSGGAGHCSP